MHARFYSPHLGRFMSVDPVGVAPSIPQAWNRYTYGLGNPVKYTDPLGLFFFPAIWDLIDSLTFFDETTVTDRPHSFDPLTGVQGLGSLLSGRAFMDSLSTPVSGRPSAASSRPPSSSSQSGCSNVPQAPPGVDMDQNLAVVGLTRALFGLDDSTMLVVAASAPGSVWDFKVHHGSSFENFGNFHFGAASAAAGLPQGVALRSAGLIQISFSRTQYDWLYSQGPTRLLLL